MQVNVTGCVAEGNPYMVTSPTYTWAPGAQGCLSFSPRTVYNDNSEVSICFIRGSA